MGTKKNPANYDCYGNADPNEPMFILLGRDEGAPDLVDKWAAQRERFGEDPRKVAEARQCANDMRSWHTDPITVCDHCLQASCWQGIFYCDDYKTAGTTQKTRKELAKLFRESSDYWKSDAALAAE
jgi:hypothetical protein